MLYFGGARLIGEGGVRSKFEAYADEEGRLAREMFGDDKKLCQRCQRDFQGCAR